MNNSDTDLPLLKVPGHNLFDVIRYMNSPNIEGAVLPHETPYPSHVISIVLLLLSVLDPTLLRIRTYAVAVAAKTIDVGIEEIMQARQAVEVFAFRHIN